MDFDIVNIVSDKTSLGRKIDISISSDEVTLQIPRLPKFGGGLESKQVSVKRFLTIDKLFLEGLGLWIGEGGKKKGIYFGNSDPTLIKRFLEFANQKIGLATEKFKATINIPDSVISENAVKEKWSKELQLPVQHFTRLCSDPRITKEYAQIYFNSVILAELMNRLCEATKGTIISNADFCVHLLRGIFAAEGSVLLRKSGVLHHITFSSKDGELIKLLEEGLRLLGIEPGKYMLDGMNLQIYGLSNFRRIKELGIHTLHPDKCEKFERGFASYKRTNVLDGDEARDLILKQLVSGPKTYDDLAAALGKARTTIQAHHMPILEREGKAKRAGKRGRAWLWALAGPEAAPSAQLAPAAESAPLGSPS